MSKLAVVLPAVLFAIGSALFLAGNVVLIVRGLR